MRRHRRPRLAAVAMAAAIALAGGVVAAGPAEASGVEVFQDFESDADLAGITVSLPGVDGVARAAYSSHGASSVRFTAGPANTPKATASATITFHAGTSGLPVTDWSGQAAVGWDFFTDLGYDATGGVTIRDTRDKVWNTTYPIHARGHTAIGAPVSALTASGVDVSSIASISVSVPRGDQPVTAYYDAFRLSGEYPYDQSAFADQAVASLLRLVPFAGVLGGLTRRLDALDRAVGHRPDAVDLRLAAQVTAERSRVTDALRTLSQGAMTAQTYTGFNGEVTAAARAVPRLTNTIDARSDAPRSDFGLASADSMSLVYPQDLPFRSTGPAPSVSLARGEYENVQVVVLPYAEALHDVSARVASVRSPGDTAGGLAVTVHPVGSLDVKPSNVYLRPVYTGWTPDPIRADLSTVDVAATDFQPYWVRLKADAMARPGTYMIRIDFSAGGARPRVMTVTARVWPFAVDETPRLATAFQYTPDITASLYGVTDPAEKTRLKHRYWDFLNQYQIKPNQIYTVDGDPAVPGGFTIRPTPLEDAVYLERHYGPTRFVALYLYAGLLDPNKPDTWPARIDAWLSQLDTAMAGYERAGVARYAYVYGFDESSGPLLRAAKQTFAAIKAKYPDLPIMTTLRDDSMGVDTGLADLVDIWAPQQDLYDQAVAERTRARGDQAWWYPDIATGHPLPNWFNGYPPIDARMLMGPMSYRAGVEGVLYYATNHWTYATHASHPLVDDGVFSAWNATTLGTTAGDGSLFYPGPDGPMASIRLENVRDGMEDYNALSLLRKELAAHPHASAAVRARARRALTASAVVTDQRDFTEDPATYRAWRDQLARAITDLRAAT